METLIDLAAVGGLLLGIINLGITIYKDFVVEGELEVSDEEFFIKMPEKYPQYYDIQIDLRLHAKKDDIFIKQVFLENKKDFYGDRHHPNNILELYRAFPYKKMSLNNSISEGFVDELDDNFSQKSFSLTDMKIEKGAIKSVTYLTRLEGVRESDGWELIPESNYKLKVTYSKKEIVKSLSPKIL